MHTMVRHDTQHNGIKHTGTEYKNQAQCVPLGLVSLCWVSWRHHTNLLWSNVCIGFYNISYLVKYYKALEWRYFYRGIV